MSRTFTKGLHRQASTPLARAVHKLDGAVSKMVRADAKECATCGLTGVPFDCGHFRWRGMMSTRFDYRNLAPQCLSCNRFQGGRTYEFSLYIDKKWGRGTAKELMRISAILKQWDVRDLDALTDAARRGFPVYKQLYDAIMLF